MKRLLALILATTAVIGFGACGKQEPANDIAKGSETATVANEDLIAASVKASELEYQKSTLPEPTEFSAEELAKVDIKRADFIRKRKNEELGLFHPDHEGYDFTELEELYKREGRLSDRLFEEEIGMMCLTWPSKNNAYSLLDSGVLSEARIYALEYNEDVTLELFEIRKKIYTAKSYAEIDALRPIVAAYKEELRKVAFAEQNGIEISYNYAQ